MREPIFKRVKCRAYLKKAVDDLYIRMYQSDGEFLMGGMKYVTSADAKAIAYRNIYKNGRYEEVEVADLSDWCGESVPKKYRERIEEDFTGFLVGYTRIKVEGRIGTDWESDPYQGEFGHCFSAVDEYPRVGVVFFKNNAKRYVYPEDMEYLDNPVDVIRCRDCRYYEGKNCECSAPVGGGMLYPNDNDYCSYGGRKNDKENQVL